IANIIGSADQMPTDRSLNRVKKLNCSRFGHQTLHRAKEKISLLASRENTTYPTNLSRLAQGGGTPGSAGCNRFKGGSGINGILPAERAPAIYSVPPLSRLHPENLKTNAFLRATLDNPLHRSSRRGPQPKVRFRARMGRSNS